MTERKVRWRTHRPPPRGRKAILVLLSLVVAAALAWFARPPRGPQLPAPGPVAPSAPGPDQVLEAFHHRLRGVEVQTAGVVMRVLKDDIEGAQHERFLIRVADTLTVLVAHNVDVAPRVPVLTGDSVLVRGEYVWDERGGVIHWTHRDREGKHAGGWVRHAGRMYE